MSELDFLGYLVPKIDFSVGDEFGNGSVQLDVNIKRSIENENTTPEKKESCYTLILSATIGDKSNRNGFCAAVTIKGGFRSTSNKLMIDNATAILFPYLRSVLSSICLAANIPPFILPTVNVAKDFHDEFSND